MDIPIQQTESPYELSRAINNLARLGAVAEVRLTAPARVRVRCAGNVTGWLPWIAHRAGGERGGRKWHPPVVGEQALVISPGGDLAQGLALLGVYSDAMSQPSEEAACERTDWNETDHWQWLDGAHEMRVEKSCTINVADAVRLLMTPESARVTTPEASISIGPGASVVIRAGSAALSIGAGGISSNVDINAEGISLETHVHLDVEPGSSTSGPPA
ncbi:MAG: phage baseplate assembly protein V [Desulfovibrionaceae bacterium]|nr:phage baseplate assembly protein V [Desulfovibrionaceae bacterium]